MRPNNSYATEFTSLSTLYAESRKRVAAIQGLLEQLDQPNNVEAVSQQLNVLLRDCDQMRSMAHESLPSSREMWIRKVTQLAQESAILRTSLDNHLHRQHRAEVEKHERTQLLERRRAAHGSTSGDTYIAMNALASEGASLDRSHQNMDQLTQLGAAVARTLGEQRQRLKHAQRTVLSVTSTLGLSTELMRTIERRQWKDSLILCGGILLTLFLIVFLWYMVL